MGTIWARMKAGRAPRIVFDARVNGAFQLKKKNTDCQVGVSRMSEVSNIFQMLIVNGGEIPQIIPSMIAENIASVKAAYPDARHNLLSGREVRDFIGGNFGSDVLAAYDKLRPYSFKADLARFCLLYKHGGLYADVGIRLLRQLEIPAGKAIVYFRDITSSSNTSWAAITGLIYAKPGRQEFRSAIELIVKNCHDQYYGVNPLCPTATVLFGRVLAMQDKPEDYFCGEARLLTPDYAEKSMGFIDPNGQIIGVKLKPGGTPCLGIAGTNDYSELWRRRQVYGECDMSWSYKDKAIHCNENRRTAEGIQIIPDNRDWQIWGPYISLDAGRYKAGLKFLAGSVTGNPHFDICSHKGRDISVYANSPEQGASVGPDGTIPVEFAIENPVENVEIRVKSNTNFKGVFLGVNLVKIA